MHKIVLAAALTGAALALAACSKTEEATDSAAATDAAAESPDAPAADTGSVLDANTATAEQLPLSTKERPNSPKRTFAGRRSPAAPNSTPPCSPPRRPNRRPPRLPACSCRSI